MLFRVLVCLSAITPSSASSAITPTDAVLNKLDADLDTLLAEQGVRKLHSSKAAPAFVVPPASFLQSEPAAPLSAAQPGQPSQPFYDPLLLGAPGRPLDLATTSLVATVP
jgi:hypothetical protein